MTATTAAPAVDVITVAYNSARTLRGCVEPLAGAAGISVTVVDNASPDRSAESVAGLPVDLVRLPENGGFSAGCNAGAATGSAPYLLLVNPDARISAEHVRTLARVLEAHPDTALVGPRIEEDGRLAFSQRRFPRLRSTYAQALFLHRAWPLAAWADELVRDSSAYERPGTPDWVSGACMLVRRTAYAEVAGLDEDFFLYCEDIDLCARLRQAGHEIRYEPAAVARHEGGASAPREELLALHARNRVLYANKHAGPAAAALERAGVALGHGTHALAHLSDRAHRRGHLIALSALVRTPAGGA